MPKHLGETSHKQTAFGIIPRSQLIPLEIEGMKRAWDFVLKAQQTEDILPTSRFLQKIHSVAFEWIFPDMAGKFRQVEVRVSDHVPPKPYQVPQLVEEICRDIKERVRHVDSSLNAVAELLAWAHHRFLWIHPFFDYNGRIGRLLINVLLLSMNFPPIELRVETKSGRKRYIEALRAADSGSFELLEKIIREAMEESVKDF